MENRTKEKLQIELEVYREAYEIVKKYKTEEFILAAFEGVIEAKKMIIKSLGGSNEN